MTIRMLITILICCMICPGTRGQAVVSADIARFWEAYDKITATHDSAQQYELIKRLFIDKGTPGLKAIMEARNYDARSYVEAIHQYPLFWKSIRQRTLTTTPLLTRQIRTCVQKLKQLYPGLKPATIYFTIGALKTGGTTLDKKVLIGSEIALADHTTVSSEFPAALSHLKSHFESDPAKGVVFTNMHEYVHTQQKTTIGDNLLAQSLLEGVAEFVAVKATGQASTLPALKVGHALTDSVRNRFAAQMFNPFNGFWLYSNDKNEFSTRDLGYYVGYAICENYYNRSTDPKQAIRQLIELDYNDPAALEALVDQSGYFNLPVSRLKTIYRAQQPVVARIEPFENKAQQIRPDLKTITLVFSEPMDTRYRNFDTGPSGKAGLMRVQQFIGFSEDGTTASFEVQLEPAHSYELLVGPLFRSKAGLALKPYLIECKTAGN